MTPGRRRGLETGFRRKNLRTETKKIGINRVSEVSLRPSLRFEMQSS